MDKNFLDKIASYGKKKGMGPMPDMKGGMPAGDPMPMEGGPGMDECIGMLKNAPDFDPLMAIKKIIDSEDMGGGMPPDMSMNM